jgi:putative transposase
VFAVTHSLGGQTFELLGDARHEVQCGAYANAFCERLVGTIRRVCLDFVIPLGERHLRAVLREWAAHYNRGRPHSSLGPGVPEGLPLIEHVGESRRHRVPEGYRVGAMPILGGLHHEYFLQQKAA